MNLQKYSRALTAVGIIAAAVALVAYQLSQFAIDASLKHWHTNAAGYRTALEQQRTSGKPVALFFHTDWCSSCKNLRETVLSTEQFDRFAQNLITVKINPEYGLEERKIADKYGVVGYPTFLIVTSNFASVSAIRTGLNMAPEKFIASCKKALGT